MHRAPSSYRLHGLRLLLAAATVASLASARPVAAEQAASPQLEYRKAHEAARLRDWAEARRILLGLWEKAKTYDVAASLSEAEYALGHVAASAQYMDYALRHVTPNESASTIATMKGALEKLRPKVGAVKVTVDDPTANLSVDGKAIDYEPEAEVFVEPGKHVFQARAGERVTSKTIDARAGESQLLELQLPPPPSPPAARSPAPAVAVSAPPPAEAHDSNEVPRTVALFVGGAVTVAGLGMGVGFGLASNSSESDVENYRARVGSAGCRGANPSADCAALRRALEGQRRDAHIANVGYGIAAAGLVTVGVALLWPRSSEAASTRASQLDLTWSGSSISLSGKF